ncbi:MAG: UTP--glucose-1-phosphate uridylyltransferase [Gammaproteobacteria bacterium RIFCSPHIGHO2_12_FULL_39_24]|nr:MAG: UTP--glucose-1-phosphate uridylyltransferase [Gammaproteobacteria bacterium RIFCSPHIGHO2_12_FULL_39_24]
MFKIKKAIFPVAGLGTRFLPVTKASPKEMLPVVDKPLIQYAVEEAIEAGIEEMIFVTSGAKRAIEDHFDRNFELEKLLQEKQKYTVLAEIRELLPKNIKVVYIRQSEPLGLGHAILCARHLINNETFAVLLADDLMYHQGPRCLAQMINIFNQKKCGGILAIERIKMSETSQYGIASIDVNSRVNAIVEKPAPEKAPTNLAIAGRYILPHAIFNYLENAKPGVGNEIQLTDAIAQLLPAHLIIAHEFKGKRYDCGNKMGYAQANFDYMCRDTEFGDIFRSWVEKRLQREFV